MSQAKDFQRATADRIIKIFEDGQKRVLLSDEVGLGKTIIARTVLEKAKSLPHVSDDGIYRVVYVCSNLNIIRQNTRNLGVSEEDIMQLSESRLSMQHLILHERTMKYNKSLSKELPVQLIPLTPATSFNITGGAGNASERALIYAILKSLPKFESYQPRLYRLLKTQFKGEENWKNEVEKYNKRVERCGEDYVHKVQQALLANPVYQQYFPQLLESVERNEQSLSYEVINKLRVAFSQVSLKQLDPDLVIMDEFQRFSGLLSTNEQSEESLIAHEFFANEHSYILLLSATPYKPFTTLEELNENNCDEQYEDFLKLMKFLFNDDSTHFQTVWEDYSKKLSHISSESFDALLISKSNAEEEMYNVMCRTERFRESLIKTVPLEKMEICEGDILSYCQMQKLLNISKQVLSRRKNIGVNPSFNIPVEYVKSSPYLLSFMQKYQEGKTVEAAFMGKDVPVVKNSRNQRLLLKWGHIYNYKPLQPGNARLEAIQDLLFQHHAERLLWIPASHPYYKIPASNVFAQNRDFSKVLVFSAWEMVPRMLAVMLSYESERLNVYSAYKEEGITYKTKKKIGLNRVQEEIGELLTYPSVYLAAKYNYKKYFNWDIKDIINDVEGCIQREIDELSVTVQRTAGAEALLSLIYRLEGKETEIKAIPQNAARTLAMMAIGSPGVCMMRIMQKSIKPQNASADYDAEKALDMADTILSIFNRRESAAAVELTTPKGWRYYDQVLHYCVMGNLQSVLDEYCHMIDEGGHAAFIEEKMNRTFISVSPYRVQTTETYCKGNTQANAMRRNFAFDYAKVQADKTLRHNGTLQQAFNSPFRPFVLATTSVGQEGLDFHWYARKIVHWNLPSNPLDMEQREGRINRFKCLAIRRNIAKFFGDKLTWQDMFEEADRVWRKNANADYSEMVPYWCLPPEIIRDYDDELEHIERIVPLYPLSEDEMRYKHLIDVLSLYRLTMGQPRQEELLDMLDGKMSPKQIEQLLFDLSPYNRRN